MANRFTDTEKWKKRWFRTLKPEHKIFWVYLLDNCDHAGIWEVDFELASFMIGVDLNESEIKQAFAKQFVEVDGGKRWFIKDFIKFQYKCEIDKLNPDSKIHASVLKALIDHGIDLNELGIKPHNDDNQTLGEALANPIERVSKPLRNPLKRVKDKDKDRDKDKDKDKDKGGDKDKESCSKEQQELKQTFTAYHRNRDPLDKSIVIARDHLCDIDPLLEKRLMRQSRAPDIELMLNILDALIAEFGVDNTIKAIEFYKASTENGKKSLNDLFALKYNGHGVLAKFGELLAIQGQESVPDWQKGFMAWKAKHEKIKREEIIDDG